MSEEDDKIGGAIQAKKVKFVDMQTFKPETDDLMRQTYQRIYPVEPSLHYRSIHPSMEFINVQPLSSYYRSMREEDIHDMIINNTTGQGASKDSSHVQRLVYDSLKHKPELLQTYLRH